MTESLCCIVVQARLDNRVQNNPVKMPLYESVMQEKPAVVFDIGNAYTKLGFAAEAYPRFIIPTTVTDVTTKVTKNLFDFEDPQEFYDQTVEFIKTLFFKYVLVSPKDRKIVIVESVLCPNLVKETLAKALFRHFEVSSIYFVPTHLVVLATLAIETALVIDLGYKEAVVIPVYSGVQVLHAWDAQGTGGEAVHKEIKTRLVENGVHEKMLTEEVIEDIKVRTCFVTTYQRALQYRKGEVPIPCPDVEYPLCGDELIIIPGVLRETAFEVLFPVDNDHTGLPYMILDCILKCPIDMRKQLMENIFLIGGTTMILGLMARLKCELLALLESDYYQDKLFLKSLKFHTAPTKSNFTAWLGGSFYGGTDLILTRSLTREAYAREPRVPDWNHFEFEGRLPGQ